MKTADLSARDNSPSKGGRSLCICSICQCQNCSCSKCAPKPELMQVPFQGISQNKQSHRHFTAQEVNEAKRNEGFEDKVKHPTCPWDNTLRFAGEPATKHDFRAPPSSYRPVSYKDVYSTDPRAETDERRIDGTWGKGKFHGDTSYAKEFTAKEVVKQRSFKPAREPPPNVKFQGVSESNMKHKQFSAAEINEAKAKKIEKPSESMDNPWQQMTEKTFQGQSTTTRDFPAYTVQDKISTTGAGAGMTSEQCGAGDKWRDQPEPGKKWHDHRNDPREFVTSYNTAYVPKSSKRPSQMLPEDGPHGVKSPIRDFWASYGAHEVYKDNDGPNDQAFWFGSSKGFVPKEARPSARQFNGKTTSLETFRSFSGNEQKEGRPDKGVRDQIKGLKQESADGPWGSGRTKPFDSRTSQHHDFGPPPREAYVKYDSSKNPNTKDNLPNHFKENRHKCEDRDFRSTTNAAYPAHQRGLCPAQALLKRNPPPAPPVGRDHIYYDQGADTWY